MSSSEETRTRERRRNPIGDAIAQRRKDLGYSQVAMATMARVSSPYVCQIENGRRPLTSVTPGLVAICLSLGWEYDDLAPAIERANRDLWDAVRGTRPSWTDDGSWDGNLGGDLEAATGGGA